MSQAVESELVEVHELDVSDGGAAKFAPVTVLSGEELYNTIYSDKAKLWRFDEGENTWKERGQGEVKILQHKERPQRHVLILRRDGTGKLAAQHDLVKGMKLMPNPASEKAWVWTSPKDYSDDDEGHEEVFFIRFSAKENADEFKKIFDKVAQ